MYAHMWRTSTIPSSSCSDPIGRCTATHFDENCSWICPSVRKKSARSRSSMLTTSTRASPSSSASFLTRAVPTSKPITPETTTSAPSTTRSAQRASPWKDGSPGQSTRLILRPCHSVWASESEIESCALLLVLVRVGDRRARLDRAEPVDLAGLEEERLDEGRLPRPAVTDDGDVADLPWLGCGHLRAFLLVRGCWRNASPDAVRRVCAVELSAEEPRRRGRTRTRRGFSAALPAVSTRRVYDGP